MSQKKTPLLCMVSIFLTLSLLTLSLVEIPSVESSDSSNVVVRRTLYCGSKLFSVQDYATKSDMYIDHFEQGWKVPQIHALNPSLIALLYRNIRAVHGKSAEYQLFVNNKWILKDPYGVPIKSTVWGYYIVDVGNPNYQQWVANWLKGYVNQYGYDGVWLDNLHPSLEILWSTAPSPAINPRTGKAWTDEEFKDAIIALVNKIKDTIGSRFVAGTAVYQGERFFGPRNPYITALLTQSRIDAVTSEGWIMEMRNPTWYSEDKWKKSIDLVVWLENNFLNKGNKMFIPVAQNVAPYNGQSESLPLGCTKEQYALYTFASLLLGASSSKHYLNFGFYVDDFSQSLLKIQLGLPSGQYYIVSGTHVYTRDFTKVKVLVNPTGQPYSVSLSGAFENLNGTSVKSPITLAPHTGIILKRSASDPILKSGFESGSLTGWVPTVTTGDTLKISTEKAHQGQYALKARTDGLPSGVGGEMAYATKFLQYAPNSLYVRVYIMFSTLPTRGNFFTPLSLRATAGSAPGLVAFVYITNINGVVTWSLYHINGNSANFRRTTTNVLAQKWYCVEVYVNVHTTAGAVALWIDGAQVYKLTNINTAAYGTTKYIQVGERWSSNTVAHSTYIDDIAVSDSYIGL